MATLGQMQAAIPYAISGDLWLQGKAAFFDALRWAEELEVPGPWLAGGVGALLLLILIVRRLNARSAKPCRWAVDRRRPANLMMVRWACRNCGVDAYSHDGSRPKECKRMLRSGRL